MADETVATTTDTTTAATATAAGMAADAGNASVAATTADAGAAAEAAETKAEPVDYTKALAEVKMPEGMTLDPEATKLGTDLFAKHNLSAEAAKDLVSLYAQQQKAGADGNAKAFATQVEGWKATAEKATTPEERGAAKEAALKVFGTDEMKLFETFGITNRSGFIKAMAKVASAIKDDTFVPGNAGGLNGSDDARKMFPKSNMNP